MSVGAALDVSVVLPTFNEAGSLPSLLPRIAAALTQAGLRGEIIVVDDNSPDGTADVARSFADKLPVRVLKRIEERGLGTAVTSGFAMSEAEVCVVMDADGSHPVEALADMVRMILTDKAEIVVGSRHVPGGGSKDWPLFSRMKSRFAASLAIGLTGMTDPTTGFMALRRSLLGNLKLDPIGWKIVLETVVKAYPVRLAEVPIVFTDREHGESKQSVKVLAQYLTHLYKLYQFRFPALVEFLKFCLVGLLGLFVDLSIVSALKELGGVDTRLCQVFGFLAAVTFNYALNRRFSFEGARNAPLWSSYVAYVGANMVGLTVRMLVIQALIGATSLDSGRGYLLLSVIGIVLATIINFVGVKYFAFAPPREEEGERISSAGMPVVTAVRSSWVWSVAGLACAALVAVGTLMQPARTHDEQVNLVMADNIRASFEGFVHPATTPNFQGDWRSEALPKLGNTPVYPLLLSVASRAGDVGLVLLSALLFALSLLGIYASVAPLRRSGAHAALLLAASAPWLLGAFSLREFEPLVAASGILGFALLIRAERSEKALVGLAAGALLGLGFAVKMWLVLPAVLASLGFLVSRAYKLRKTQLPALRKLLFTSIVGFVVLAGAHLAFVAIAAPQDSDAWIEWVYLGLFSGHGVTSAKLSASGWGSSAWAYLLWLVRDHGALLAPIVLGLPSVTRRVSALQIAWFSALVFALLGIVPLSVPAYKEPLYLLPVLPFFYAFAGLAVSAPDHSPPRYAKVDRGAAKLSLLIAAALLSYWLAHTFDVDSVARNLALLHVAHIAIWTAPSFRVLRQKPGSSALLPCALASILLAALLTATASLTLDS